MQSNHTTFEIDWRIAIDVLSTTTLKGSGAGTLCGLPVECAQRSVSPYDPDMG